MIDRCIVYQSKYEVFEKISVCLSEGHAVGVEPFYEACHVAVCFLGLLRDVFFYYCPLNPKTTPLTFRKTEVWLSAYHGQAPFVKK